MQQARQLMPARFEIEISSQKNYEANVPYDILFQFETIKPSTLNRLTNEQPLGPIRSNTVRLFPEIHANMIQYSIFETGLGIGL